MDPTTFDTLARSCGSSPSRRTVASGVLAGLFALVLSTGEPSAKRGQRRGKDRAGETAHDHARGHSLEAEKKKRKGKKQQQPASCAPACAGKACGPDGCGGACGTCAGNRQCQSGQCVVACTPACSGKVCGADGCGGACGPCGSGESCDNGACVPRGGTCSPACVGGQVCQPNGACVCPAATPIFHSGLGLCMECNLDTDCGLGNRFTGYQCRHDRGHTCHCGEGMVDCGEGYCSDCCTREDCMLNWHFDDASVICTAPGNPRGAHICVCPEGLTSCSGGSAYCADLRHDPDNCGSCGHVCTGGTHCNAGDCRLE